MIMEAGLPPEALDDPFRPPDEPVMVRCLHCGQEYSSEQIHWERQADGTGMWVCDTPGCSGAGFEFDIFPLDCPNWGEKEEEEDDEAECEDDDRAEDEEGPESSLEN